MNSVAPNPAATDQAGTTAVQPWARVKPKVAQPPVGGGFRRQGVRGAGDLDGPRVAGADGTGQYGTDVVDLRIRGGSKTVVGRPSKLR